MTFRDLSQAVFHRFEFQKVEDNMPGCREGPDPKNFTISVVERHEEDSISRFSIAANILFSDTV